MKIDKSCCIGYHAELVPALCDLISNHVEVNFSLSFSLSQPATLCNVDERIEEHT